MRRRCSRFSYLGYLAGITYDILLGTGAVVLPIREPLLTVKSARSVQRLSGDRLLLGVASGDRPVEYPLFGRDFDTRGDRFREQIALLREGAASAPAAGLGRAACGWPGCRCSWPAWPSSNRRGSASMDGCLAYQARHRTMRSAWRPGAPWRQQAVCQLHPPGPGGRCRCPAAALALWAAQRPARPCWPSCTPCRRPVSTTSACSSAATNGRWPRPSTDRRVRAAALPGPCRRRCAACPAAAPATA